MKNKKGKNKEEKKRIGIPEIIFYSCLTLVALTCLTSAITSTMSFTNSQNYIKESFNSISDTFSSYAQNVASILKNNSVVATNTTANTEKDKKNSNNEDINNIVEKKMPSDDDTSSSEDDNNVIEFSELEKSLAKEVEYIERLQKVQDNSSRNSVMSFIYAILGAVLTAAGAALVAFIFKSKELASEAADDSKIAKKSASEAVESANIAKAEAESAKDIYEQQLSFRQSVIDLQSIYIEIANMRYSLATFNKNDINDRLKTIKAKVNSLNLGDCDMISQFKNELCKLRESIAVFNDENILRENLPKYLDDKNIKNIDNSIASYKKAFKIYDDKIKNLIDYCDAIN